MRLVSSVLALGALSLAAPASAAVVFSDTFDAENGGNSSLNYAAFANFSVVGKVDLVKSGNFGISCSGSCVDLDGSPGPGMIKSLSSFAFSAGDKVRLSFDIGGNQRNSDFDGFYAGFDFGVAEQMLDYGFNFGGGDIVVLPSVTQANITTSSGIAGNKPFSTYSIFFTAGTAGALSFNIGTDSRNNVGPLLDKVALSIDKAAVPEPAAWAMMLAGFGLVGSAMRRRQKTAITFA